MLSILIRIKNDWIRFEADTPENLLTDVHSMIKAGMDYEPFLGVIPKLVNPETNELYHRQKF